MQKIDIHTHRHKNDSSVQILNIFAQDLLLPGVEGFYSTGLHPWHIELVNQEECLHTIELASVQKNMLAVGECGLDRSIATNFASQELYFRKQIEIAEKYAKPLIIHCVRAFPELIKLKKEYKSDIPWIIHAFQGNRPTTLELIRHDFYFSVGESLLRSHPKNEILTVLPSDRLFLETDDREISIGKIYSLAAKLLMIDEETLSVIIHENFKRLFGNGIVVNDNLT